MPPASHHPLTVLVVDDSADTAESCGVLLRLYGYDVRTARSADDALALLQGWEPDVALLDLRMPGTDGYQLARRLAGRPGGRTLLVAVTGLGAEADHREADLAGFDHYLVKPVEPDVMNDLLRSHAAGLSGG